jgi:hypothetical protein
MIELQKMLKFVSPHLKTLTNTKLQDRECCSQHDRGDYIVNEPTGQVGTKLVLQNFIPKGELSLDL